MASGAPLNGVAVSARAVGRTFTTTVYSDEKGEYFFPELERGQYRVWAQATGYETARAGATLDAAGRTRQAFTLNPIDDPTPQLRGPEWLAALPEETFEDRRMKEVFRVQCSECHQASLPLQNRFDERGWLAIISAMEKAGYNGLNAASTRAPVAMRYHKAELAKHLTRMRGPGPSPMKLRPVLPRPMGDAARVVITEYDVQPADMGRELVLWNGEDWSEGTPSGQHGGRSGLHDVAIDRNGNAWITTWGAVTQSLRTLVKLDPKTGKLTAYNVVRKSAADSVYTHGITVDQDGILMVQPERDTRASGSRDRYDRDLYSSCRHESQWHPRCGQDRQGVDSCDPGRPPIRSSNEDLQVLPKPQRHRRHVRRDWRCLGQWVVGPVDQRRRRACGYEDR